jgi:N-ethylmaleimide reductase
MTRTRATEDGVPPDLMARYYSQRASAGLNITECTAVSDQARGIIRGPGIHRDDQIAGWRKVTDAVHAAGGRIYNQIWHTGRVSHPEIRNGEPPVGSCPIPASGNVFLPRGRVELPVPRVLEAHEIPGIIEDFAQRRATPAKPASTASSCTAPTATCTTSSCRTDRTDALTPGAARSPIAPAS